MDTSRMTFAQTASRLASAQRQLPACACAAAACLGLLASPTSWANDRPFDVARTAVAEDDDQAWGFSSWLRTHGGTRSLSIEPEYAFSPENGIQLELSRQIDKRGGESGQGAELEFKHLFNQLARDGWAWGVSASLGAQRSADTRRWTPSVTLRWPVSLDVRQLYGGDAGGPILHLNLGAEKARRQSWEALKAVAAEQAITPRWLVFGEWSQQAESRARQAGVRHWIRKEKWAVDVAWHQRSQSGTREGAWLLGMSWFDL